MVIFSLRMAIFSSVSEHVLFYIYSVLLSGYCDTYYKKGNHAMLQLFFSV